MAPVEMRALLTELYRGSMAGRTMYVVPFCMGPLDAEDPKFGVEITDSAYVAASMKIMTRMGTPVLDVMPLDPAQAARLLAATAATFVFYTDRDTGRGKLLYRRYDGGLGLVSPISSDPPPAQSPFLSASAEPDEGSLRAGHCGSQDAVGVLLEIANNRTASARSSTAAPA